MVVGAGSNFFPHAGLYYECNLMAVQMKLHVITDSSTSSEPTDTVPLSHDGIHYLHNILRACSCLYLCSFTDHLPNSFTGTLSAKENSKVVNVSQREDKSIVPAFLMQRVYV